LLNSFSFTNQSQTSKKAEYMRDIVHTMLRLQYLELIKEECEIIHFGSNKKRIEAVQRQYNELLGSLPDQWRERYLMLRKRGSAVVKEFGGMCQGCRMSLNIRLLQRMRDGEADWLCPNCGRFLFLNEDK